MVELYIMFALVESHAHTRYLQIKVHFECYRKNYENELLLIKLT